MAGPTFFYAATHPGELPLSTLTGAEGATAIGVLLLICAAAYVFRHR